MNTGRTHFKKGNIGRRKGTKNKFTSIKNILLEVFTDNEEKARALLNKMFDNKHDFKWLMQLIATFEPKNGVHIDNSQHQHFTLEILSDDTDKNKSPFSLEAESRLGSLKTT